MATVHGEIVQISAPVPVPAEWARQDLAGRNEAENIRVDGNAVTISLSGDAGSMVSRDLGDTWELELDAKGSGQTS